MIDEIENALRIQVIITKKCNGGEELEVMRKSCIVDLDIATDPLELLSKGFRMLNRAIEFSIPEIVSNAVKGNDYATLGAKKLISDMKAGQLTDKNA